MSGRVIIGCGDIGRRLVSVLQHQSPGLPIDVTVRSRESLELAAGPGVKVHLLDLDDDCLPEMDCCRGAELYYLVPPQRDGITDQRSFNFIQWLSTCRSIPRKLVLLSTTGVYGDYAGEWVTEESPAQPATDRGRRRLDSERQWQGWGVQNNVAVVILRVPGIYAFSRIPRQRIENRTPVVRSSECGYTNRIHADDLAEIMYAAMRRGRAGEVYNVSDGVPGTVTEYLQAAAQKLGLAPLPEISMAQAAAELSEGMLSYLRESRKISNRKMLDELQVVLRYPDFNEGLQQG